jgi:hypothetical protein
LPGRLSGPYSLCIRRQIRKHDLRTKPNSCRSFSAPLSVEGQPMWNISFLVMMFAYGLPCFLNFGFVFTDGQEKKAEAAKIEQMKETGELKADSERDKVKTDHAIAKYPLQCIAGRTYIIDLKSGDFDAWLQLLNPEGKEVASDDDNGGGPKGTDAQIKYKADKAGMYTIVATTFAPGEKGKYTLTVSHDGAGKEDQSAGGKYLLDVAAKLTKDDPKDKDRGGTCHYKSYKIELKANTTYKIQLDSKDFDAYLRLLGPDGKELTYDDDGAHDGLNAKIIFDCEKDDTYAIIATSFAHPDTGEFHLRVQVTEKEKESSKDSNKKGKKK